MANSQTITINVKAIADMSDVLSNTKQIQNALSQLKLPNNLTQQFTQNFSNIEREAAKVQAILAKPVKTKADLTGLDSSVKKINTELQHLQTGISKIDPSILKESFQIDTSKLEAATKEVEKWQAALKQKVDSSGIQSILDAYKQFQESGRNNQWVDNFVKAFQSGDIVAAEEALNKLNSQVKLFQTNSETKGGKWVTTYADYKKVVDSFADSLTKLKGTDGLQDIIEKLQQAKTTFEGLRGEELQQFLNAFQTQGPVAAIQQLINGTNTLGNSLHSTTAAQVQLNSELGQVKSRIQYFLGLSNAVNLFKRAVRGAFNTVKELDKAMTETAVVTDFTVGDMWAQLPRYTQVANELGVTTKGAYETMTLFYQQGLDTNEAFALGTQTMKMARIAGMDYTEATDAMTAALRGFNMELNETSAQKVNDVYSQLAAKTASNVEEISTAMSKVASIAHNAGMEFETTSAFLSQIIETTREAPETAGTALKTVIARFTELKKAPSEIGEVEGEMVDANKIETALKSVGVALRDTKGEFRDLDDVFIELSSKWDGLTKNQQRYVATMAAGSRQQSRFIAMMSDYSRTQELIGEAYDSSGASQKQYEKTLDSLESKLNKLKNAWNEFLMGLTNSTVIKGGIDALTTILNLINKLTSAFGNGVGSVLKWTATIAGFAGLKKLFRNGGIFEVALAKIGNGPLGKVFGLGGNKITGEAQTAGKIIVSSAQKFASIVTGAAEAAATTEEAGAITETSTETGGGVIETATETSGAVIEEAIEAAGIYAIIGAIITAVGIASYKLWENYTPSGQLHSAEKLSESLNSAAQGAIELSDTLNDIPSTYQEYEEAIANASTAQERDKAITDRNSYVNDLIQNNAEFAKFVNAHLVNGKLELTIDQEKLATSIANAETVAARASANASFGQAAVAARQAAVYDAKISGWTYDETNQRVYSTEYDSVTGENFVVEHSLQAYLNYVEQSTQATAEAIQAATEGYLQYLQGTDLEDSTAEGLATAFATTFNAKDFIDTTSIEKVWGTVVLGALTSPLSNIGKEYNYADELKKAGFGLSLFGTDGLAYTKDEIDYLAKVRNIETTGLDYRDRLQLIQEYDYSQQQEDKLAEAVELISQNEAKYGAYLSAYSGNFGDQNVLGKTLKDILPEYNAETFSELSKIIGIPAGEIAKQLQLQLKQQQEARKQQLIETGTEFNGKGFTRAGFNLEAFMALDNIQYQDYITDILSNIENANFGAVVGNSLLAGMSSVDWEGSDLQKWISSIDFSNPIAAAAALREGTASLNQEIRDTASAWELAAETSGAFSAESQVQYLLTSESFNSLNEQLDDFIKENGKISADNVEELAESCAELEQLLENNVISANGLANILNGIQAGAFGVLDVNNALIEASNSLNSLDNMTADIINHFNEFDPGMDENDIAAFINSAYETVKENVDKGAYGNTQMRNYLTELFGADVFDFGDISLEEYGAKYEATVDSLLSILEKNKDNMYAAWADLATVPELSDMITDTGEEIILNTAGRTTDEIIQELVEKGNVTRTWAEAMLADMKNYSADLAYELAQNDVPTALEKWANELPVDAAGVKYFTEESKQNFYELAQSAGASIESIDKAWEEQFGDQEAVTFDTDQITGQMEQLGYSLSAYTQAPLEGKIPLKIDVDQMRADLESAGLYTEEALNAMINAATADVSEFDAIVNGEVVSAMKGAGEDGATALQEGIASADAAAAAQSLSDAIQSGFSAALTSGGEVNLGTDEATNNLTALGLAIDETQANAATETQFGLSNTNALSNITTIQNRWNNMTLVSKSALLTINWQLGSGNMASGGFVKSYASGNRSVNPGPALTGEEGPEIVWNKEKGYAYITGSQHPEFQNLQPGDRVFNAQETKKILNGSLADGGVVGSYATGYKNAVKYNQTTNKKSTVSGTKASKSTSSGSKASADAEFWENELDWLYNLLEDIAALQQEANQLQALQDAYMSDDSKTGKDLYKLLVKQLGNLNAQLLGNQQLLERREQEMGEFMAQTNRFPDLVRYNSEDRTLEIDWDAIDQLNKTDYDMVTEFISKAENIQSNIRDAENAVLDVEKELREFENVWRDEYINFEETVGQALINSQQKVIDNYSDLNDTLSDNNSQILDSLSESISLSRQIRDNTKTEEEIADMEARLAYLRRDTTGGNQAEIKNLEKELEDARQSYEDTLVDQALDRLKDENDAAAEQRQQEIDLMQAQLDYAEQSGEFNKEIRDLIESARDEGGGFRADSELMALLKEDSDFNAKTADAQNQWMDELLTTFKTVSGYVEKQEQESTGNFANEIAAVLQDEINKHDALPESSGTDRDIGSPNGDIGSQSQGAFHVDVNKDYTGWVQNEKTGDWYYTKKGEVQTGWIKSGSKWYYMDESRGGIMATGETVDKKGNIYWLGTSGAYTSGWAKGENGDWYYTKDGYAYDGWKYSSGKWYYIDHGKMARGWASTPNGYTYLDPTTGVYAGGTKGREIDGQTYYFDAYGYAQNLTDEQISAIEAAIKKRKGQTEGFLTGGLTSKTGLAMLHGTPSAPEYVLNAAQTQAFLKLADVLPSVLNQNTGAAGALGGINLNLVMNVDEIGSDYDVDRIANRVKEIIYNAGSYRNVNTLNFLR